MRQSRRGSKSWSNGPSLPAVRRASPPTNAPSGTSGPQTTEWTRKKSRRRAAAQSPALRVPRRDATTNRAPLLAMELAIPLPAAGKIRRDFGPWLNLTRRERPRIRKADEAEEGGNRGEVRAGSRHGNEPVCVNQGIPSRVEL